MTLQANSPRRPLGLRTKVVVSFTLVAVVIALYASGSLYLNLRATVLSETQQKLLDIVSFAALSQDGDSHAELFDSASFSGPDWERLNAVNEAVLGIDHDILAIYTLEKNAGGQMVFVLDAGVNRTDPDQPYAPQYAGLPFTNPTFFLQANFDNLDGPIVESNLTTGSDPRTAGGILSAYAPFYRADGTRAGIVGVDLSADSLRAAYRQALLTALVAFLIAVPLSLLVGYAVGNTILQPILKIVDGARIIAAGQLEHQITVDSKDETQELAATINSMTAQLRTMFSSLEQRVADRTRELAEAIQRSDRRASQFEAVSQVAREIATLQNQDALLAKITELISTYFKVYHVGIFLNDDDNRFVVLRSTNSPGGQKMLARGHQLKIGEVGMVGNVAATGQARIALDTQTDDVFYKNPDLPDTRSEMSLPLRIGSRVTGVLDVQSTEPNAFSREDIEVLTTLADQVSIALENARLFDTTQRSLAEAELAYREYIKKEWVKYSMEKTPVGFSRSSRGTKALETPVHITPPSASDGQSGHIYIPLKIREEVIGKISVVVPSGKEVTREQFALVQAVADRLSLSLENARLFEETTRRAERERTVSEITTRVRGSTDPQDMLQIAVEELQRILGTTEIKIRPYASLRGPSSPAAKEPDAAPTPDTTEKEPPSEG